MRGLTIGLLAVVVSSGIVHAGTLSLYAPTNLIGPQFNSPTWGIEFQISSPITVVSLGAYTGSSLGSYSGSTLAYLGEVGQTGALATAVVDSSSTPNLDGFAYTNITPVVLNPGFYVVAAHSCADSSCEPWYYLNNPTASDMNFAGGITYIGTGGWSGSGVVPSLTDTTHLYVGGNLQFGAGGAAAPEPAGMFLLGAGLLAVVYVARRRSALRTTAATRAQ